MVLIPVRARGKPLATIFRHIRSIQPRNRKFLTIFANADVRELTYTKIASEELMRVRPSLLCLFVITGSLLPAADVQGVVIDRNCAQDILKHGRKIVLNRRRDCSLMKNYLRAGYGIITDDHKFLSFDDAGNKKAVRLLENTPDKDDLKVIVSGEIDGDTIKVATMSML